MCATRNTETSNGPLARFFRGILTTLFCFLLPGLLSTQLTAAPYQQATGTDGRVSIEAEGFDVKVSKGGKSWTNKYPSGYSGTGALITSPNTGTNNNTGYATNSPRLDYVVNFVKTGVHYVWVRGAGPTDNDDSLHVGLDGVTLNSSNRISNFSKGLSWTNTKMGRTVATINVATAGKHTLNVWMREDGTVFDKIVLTKNRAYIPVNKGPSVSTRSTTGSTSYKPVVTLSTNKLNFGSQNIGGISDPSSVKLTNSGTAPLYISNIATSSGFIQANNCNDNVSIGGSCIINVEFVPATTGTNAGTLTIIGDDAVGTHIVSLTGTGNDGDQSDVPPSNAVLHVDFSNRSLGLYRNADIRQDFNVNLNGYNDTVHGEDYGLMIADDPTGSGRGHVMRSVHYKGKAGSSTSAGGFRWRADMPPANEYYFTYDYYVTSDHIFPKNFKMPGLISNDLLRASHPTGTINTVDGLEGFSAFMQAYSDDAWHRGDGSLGVLYYDKNRISGVDWLNTIDPTLSKANAGTYRIPRGQWITIEQRVQLNTVNKSNGIMQVWVNGVLVLDENTHKWIASNVGFDNSGQKIDGIFMTSHYGGNPSDPLNRAAQTQYHYYDNFIVSPAPITH